MTWARGWGQANGWKGGELQHLEHVSGSIYSGEGVSATYNTLRCSVLKPISVLFLAADTARRGAWIIQMTQSKGLACKRRLCP